MDYCNALLDATTSPANCERLLPLLLALTSCQPRVAVLVDYTSYKTLATDTLPQPLSVLGFAQTRTVFLFDEWVGVGLAVLFNKCFILHGKCIRQLQTVYVFYGFWRLLQTHNKAGSVPGPRCAQLPSLPQTLAPPLQFAPAEKREKLARV